jgi:hypothetical protein
MEHLSSLQYLQYEIPSSISARASTGAPAKSIGPLGFGTSRLAMKHRWRISNSKMSVSTTTTGCATLIKIQPMIRNGKLPCKYVKNVFFKNVFLTGSTEAVAPGVIYVSGADARHVVEGIRFENVTRYGQCVQEHAASVKIGKHATDIHFLCPGGNSNTTVKP